MLQINQASNKREIILKSAYKVFMEQGYHSAKVSDVANLAQVGKGTVYEYFSSKEELLRGVIKEGIKYYMQELNKSTANATNPWEKIKNMVKKHADILRNNQNISNLMFNNFGIMTEEFHQFLIEQRKTMIKTVQQLIEEGIKSNTIMEMDKEIGARIIIGSMVSLNCETVCLTEEKVEELINTLGKGFLP